MLFSVELSDAQQAHSRGATIELSPEQIAAIMHNHLADIFDGPISVTPDNG